MRGVFLSTLASLLLLSSVAPAPACINDRDVDKTEREFKSNYEFKSDYREQPAIESPSPAQQRGQELAFGGFGTVLLMGAAVITTRKLR